MEQIFDDLMPEPSIAPRVSPLLPSVGLYAVTVFCPTIKRNQVQRRDWLLIDRQIPLDLKEFIVNSYYEIDDVELLINEFSQASKIAMNITQSLKIKTDNQKQKENEKEKEKEVSDDESSAGEKVAQQTQSSHDSVSDNVSISSNNIARLIKIAEIKQFECLVWAQDHEGQIVLLRHYRPQHDGLNHSQRSISSSVSAEVNENNLLQVLVKEQKNTLNFYQLEVSSHKLHWQHAPRFASSADGKANNIAFLYDEVSKNKPYFSPSVLIDALEQHIFLLSSGQYRFPFSLAGDKYRHEIVAQKSHIKHLLESAILALPLLGKFGSLASGLLYRDEYFFTSAKDHAKYFQRCVELTLTLLHLFKQMRGMRQQGKKTASFEKIQIDLYEIRRQVGFRNILVGKNYYALKKLPLHKKALARKLARDYQHAFRVFKNGLNGLGVYEDTHLVHVEFGRDRRKGWILRGVALVIAIIVGYGVGHYVYENLDWVFLQYAFIAAAVIGVVMAGFIYLGIDYSLANFLQKKFLIESIIQTQMLLSISAEEELLALGETQEPPIMGKKRSPESEVVYTKLGPPRRPPESESEEEELEGLAEKDEENVIAQPKSSLFQQIEQAKMIGKGLAKQASDQSLAQQKQDASLLDGANAVALQLRQVLQVQSTIPKLLSSDLTLTITKEIHSLNWQIGKINHKLEKQPELKTLHATAVANLCQQITAVQEEINRGQLSMESDLSERLENLQVTLTELNETLRKALSVPLTPFWGSASVVPSRVNSMDLQSDSDAERLLTFSRINSSTKSYGTSSG